MDIYTKSKEAAKYIRSKIKIAPKTAVILGTGLGGLEKKMTSKTKIAFEDIPHFPVSTAPGHKGNLIVGRMKGKSVVIMEGRLHFYEGYSLEEVTLPVRVFKRMGVKNLIVSNACGGINPQFEGGDIMLIEDHINLMGVNPLIGPNDDRIGDRFPDMCEPYDKKFLKLAKEVALAKNINVQVGVYAGMTGPCLETRAEYRMLKTLGADVIGMSTVPEIIVAVHEGLRSLGLSIVTDECLPDCLEKVDIDKIIATANAAAPKLETIVQEVVAKIG